MTRKNWSVPIRIAGLVMLVLLALQWPNAVSAQLADRDYDGSDGGYLIYSVGTSRIGMHFNFPYRRITDAAGTGVNDWAGRIRPHVGGAFTLGIRNPHFSDGVEAGHVLVRRLPAGRYRIDNFSFSGSSPTGAGYRWSSGIPFVIAFDIVPNQATYIGRFIRSPSVSASGVSLYRSLGAAGYFVISNRADQDVPIAQARVPALPAPNVQVADVSLFNSPVLRSTYIP